MENEELFCKSMARLLNYRSKLETRNILFEKAISGDTIIIDSIGFNELFEATVDIFSLMFTNLSKESISFDLDWYVFERSDTEPFIEVNGVNYQVDTYESFYEYFCEVNK